MTVSLLGIGLLLSLDSLIACTCLGTLPISLARRRGLVFLFGACDGCGSLFGACIRGYGLEAYFPWCDWVGPLALGAYGAAILYLVWHTRSGERETTGLVAGRWIFLLPLLLSVDNLLVGIGPERPECTIWLAALFLGMTSGLSAALGLRLGTVLRNRLPLAAEYLGGGLLVLLACILSGRELLS